MHNIPDALHSYFEELTFFLLNMQKSDLPIRQIAVQAYL